MALRGNNILASNSGVTSLMSREAKPEREKRLAEALRRNLARRKQARLEPDADQPEDAAPGREQKDTRQD